MIKIILKSRLDEIKDFVTERIMQHILSGQVNKFECHKLVNLMCLKWYNISELDSRPEVVTICFSQEDLFFICENENCAKRVKDIVKSDSSNDKILYWFFANLIKDDISYLEEFEERVTETEDDLITTSKKECAGIIISYRRELLILKKYYEQLNHIFEGLTDNENELISLEDLRYFKILDARIDRLYAKVLNLRDYVTQVREAYQAQIDIEQNNIMKVFTVVTAIFLPLSLIAGWYGMNLKMPEYDWQYGYIFVIILSILIVIASIIFFKFKKWF